MHFKSDFVNNGGENPMEIAKDTTLVFSYESGTLTRVLFSIYCIIYFF